MDKLECCCINNESVASIPPKVLFSYEQMIKGRVWNHGEARPSKNRRELAKVQLCGAFLTGLGGVQIHLSPPYILWHFAPKRIQENSRNGAVNLQHMLVNFIGGGKTKHVQRGQRVIIFE